MDEAIEIAKGSPEVHKKSSRALKKKTGLLANTADIHTMGHRRCIHSLEVYVGTYPCDVTRRLVA